jgi:hypothetical protein
VDLVMIARAPSVALRIVGLGISGGGGGMTKVLDLAQRNPTSTQTRARERLHGIRSQGRVVETKPYNAVALVDSTWEHEPLPSSREATGRASLSQAEDYFA